MEKLRSMDQRFRIYGEDKSQLLDGLYYVAIVVMELCMLFPKNDEFSVTTFIAAVATGVAVRGAVSPRLYCMEEGKNISIYRKLRYVPLSKGTLRRYHWGILGRHLALTLIPALLLQMLGNQLWHCWSWENFFRLLLVVFILPLCMGLWDIWRASRT